MTTKETGMAAEVGKVIAEQIGTGAFAMMGAKNLTAGEKSLSWKLGGGALKKATHVTVTLDWTDTYTVETLKCSAKKGTREVLETVEMVYWDGLKTAIEKMTGFYLSL